MRLYNTVNDIQVEMETLYRNVTGRASFTAGERDIVYSAIIDSYLIVLMEYGIDNFQFKEEDVTVDTTAGTNYIDLDEYIYKIVSGSVRIPAKEIILGLVDEVAMFQTDPNSEDTGTPYAYAYKSSTDPNVMRLRLFPTPNAVFTIALQVMKLPTDIITNFPIHVMNVIKLKAKALSCLNLALIQVKPGFDSQYEEELIRIKDGFQSNTPKYVQRTFYRRPNNQSLQGRIND